MGGHPEFHFIVIVQVIGPYFREGILILNEPKREMDDLFVILAVIGRSLKTLAGEGGRAAVIICQVG